MINLKDQEQMKSSLLIIAVISVCLLFVFACDIFRSDSIYADPAHWLALPDSIEKNVDLFYLYPTVWAKSNESDPPICEIDNAMMRQGAPLAFSRQASVFDSIANIYAPYYRQADAAYTLSLSAAEQDSMIRGIPYANVKDAFDHYIETFNNGRPFILAGHSQGSNILLYLLSDYMKDHPLVYENMIAAYVIGYSVTSDFLAQNPHLHFAQGPDDIGVIISYNTEAPVIGEPGNPVVCDSALAINPINWRRDEVPATADENLGAISSDSLGLISRIPAFTDARVDLNRGVVIASTPDPAQLAPGDGIFGRGVYHRYDYAFYYYNLRKNAAERINTFMKNE